MKNALSSWCAFQILCAIGLVCMCATSFSQTPAQLEYERQQREYWRQQEQQRQEDERIRKLNEENRRREQESVNAAQQRAQDASRAANQQLNQNIEDAQRRQQGALNQSASVSAQLEQARQEWLKKPALPPEKNPLLVGRWTRPASSGSHSTDQFAQLAALAKGGLCELMFGGGVFEFRQDRLIGMDNRSPPQELDRVEYRGDSKRVIVIPKTTFKLMDFVIEGPDRISWASQKCVLVRAGPATGAAASSAGAPVPSAAPATAQRTAAAAGGVLVLTAGATTAASQQFLILNEDPQVTLIRAGLKSTPDGSVLQNWLRACIGKTPNCQKGAQALQPHALGSVKSDESRRAQTPTLPAGRYWVLSDAKIGDKRWIWSQPVDVKAGTQSLTLDQHNGVQVD